MRITKEYYLQIVKPFKHLINENLFNIIEESKTDIFKINDQERSKILKDLETNIENLYFIFNKVEKQINIPKPLSPDFNDYLKHSHYIISKHSEIYDYFIKRNIPTHNIKNKNDFYKFIMLINLFKDWILKCKQSKLVLSTNTPEFKDRAIDELKKAFNKKQELIKNLKNKKGIREEIQKNSNKIVSSQSIERFHFKNYDEILILATFSGFEPILNKSTEQSIYAKYFLGQKLGLDKYNHFKNTIINDFKNNRRSHLSSIASTTYIDTFKGNQNLLNLILNKNPKINEKNYTKLKNSNIKNIIYIYHHELENCNFYNTISPKFINLIENNSSFKLTVISLRLFSLIISTLTKEIKNIRKFLSINKEITIEEEDLTTNKDLLYYKISSFFDLKRSICIFDNSSWSTILKELYKDGIEISGGSLVKRHILSPMDYSLATFLTNFSENGYKDTVVSTNLLDKSIYQSKFEKPKLNEYDPLLLAKTIEIKIDLILEQIIKNIKSIFEILDLIENSEFIYNLKIFILNEIIFIQKPNIENAIYYKDFILYTHINIFYRRLIECTNEIIANDNLKNQHPVRYKNILYISTILETRIKKDLIINYKPKPF